MIRLVLLVALALSASSCAVLAQTWTEHVIAGMYGPPYNTESPDATGGKAPFRAHAALAEGLPMKWNWSRGARAMSWNSPPKAGGAVAYYVPALTGRAGDAMPNTHGKNYRLHVRNYEMWYFGAESRTWILLDATKAKGGYYTKGPRFSHTGAMSAAQEADGSVSFASKAGNWLHFYSSTWPNKRPAETPLYLHMRAEMKLSGPDAAGAKVIGSVGADYKPVDAKGKLVNAAGAADGKAPLKAVLSSAMHYISTEYTWFTSSTMTPEEIRANPPPRPPGWRDSTPAAEPRSPSTDPLAASRDPAPPSSPEATADASSTAPDH